MRLKITRENQLSENSDSEEERAGEKEPSFIEDNPRDQSMVIIDPSVPNIRRDVGVFRCAYTQDKKDFLRKELGININKSDGPNSSIVIDALTENELREFRGILRAKK